MRNTGYSVTWFAGIGHMVKWFQTGLENIMWYWSPSSLFTKMISLSHLQLKEKMISDWECSSVRLQITGRNINSGKKMLQWWAIRSNFAWLIIHLWYWPMDTKPIMKFRMWKIPEVDISHLMIWTQDLNPPHMHQFCSKPLRSHQGKIVEIIYKEKCNFQIKLRNIFAKVKLLIMKNLAFCYNFFKSYLLQRCQNA